MEKDSRTSLLKKNIFFSFVLKGWAGLVQVLLVPFTLFCLGNYENGIWMTIFHADFYHHSIGADKLTIH